MLLGGCAQVAVPPTASPIPTRRVPITSRPIPTTSAPTANPSPAPTPTFDSAVGDAIIQLFLANFAAAQPPFDIECLVVGDISAGSQSSTIEINIEGQIDGEDFAGSLGAGQRRVTIAEVVLKDAHAYVRSPGNEWDTVDDFGQTQPLNPFTLLAVEDLTYVGRADRDGAILHQLRTTRWIGDDPAASVEVGVSDPRIEGSQFDLYVDSDGIPVEAELIFEMTARIGLEGQPERPQRANFDYTVVYYFFDVGVPNEIEAPIP
jgi:hypothetical protein